MTRPYIWTRGGVRLYIEPRTVDELPSRETIAESLGGQTRWTGHAGLGYTTADHALAVSRCAIQMVHRIPNYPHHWALVGLAALDHDSHEVFGGDINTVIKRALIDAGCHELRRLARNFDLLLDEREGYGGLLFPLLPLIHEADMAVAQAEAELLPIAVPADVAREAFGFNGEALTIAKLAVVSTLNNLACLSPVSAFMKQYEELRGRL
jgi:5'-deoxynucleotidase YfbR-like HD superfamily hydrolase